MIQLLVKVFQALFFWGIFVYVIFQVPYPKSLTSANFFQLFAFFAPLFLGLIFTINILLNQTILSAILSLGVVILLILKGLNSLNFVTSTLTIMAMALLVSYFRKTKGKSYRLTSHLSIPKLKSFRRRK